MSVPWSEVVAAVTNHRWRGRPLLDVSEDSRHCRPGSVFVARPGRQGDGHDFATAAVDSGAVLVVAERPCDVGVPVCLVPSAPRALAQLAAAWYGKPAADLDLVGVTGTNGKTTVVTLARAILSAAGRRTFSLGTTGFWLDSRLVAPHLRWTTPPALELQALCARAVAAGANSGVLEVSAQALDQHRVAGCRFGAAAITNVSREHGEYFDHPAAYLAAKISLFRGDDAPPPAWSVVNASLPEVAAAARQAGSHTLVYGPDAGDVRLYAYEPHGLDGSRLRVTAAGELLDLRLWLPGRYNVENALAAVALGLALDVSPADVARGIESVTTVPGRWQVLRRRPYRVIVDYAHNPAALRAVLSLVRQSTPGRLLLVMGARGERDENKRPLMGAVAAGLCDQIIFTSDRPGREDPARAAAPMVRAALDCGGTARYVDHRRSALTTALDALRPGDSLVVTGKGDEPWLGDGEADPDTTDVAVLCELLDGQSAVALS